MEEEERINESLLSKEIIGNSPKWIIRWGITIIVSTFILLAIILSMIKYPLSLNTSAVLTYQSKPVEFTSGQETILVKSTLKDGSFVKKGARVIIAEKIAEHSDKVISAPISGIYYAADHWNNHSLFSHQELIGFVVPSPNERVIKINLNAAKHLNLHTGQSVDVNLNDYLSVNLKISGYIDFISPKLNNTTGFISIKFSPATNARLDANKNLRRSDNIKCSVNLIVDTTSYLRYLIHR